MQSRCRRALQDPGRKLRQDCVEQRISDRWQAPARARLLHWRCLKARTLARGRSDNSRDAAVCRLILQTDLHLAHTQSVCTSAPSSSGHLTDWRGNTGFFPLLFPLECKPHVSSLLRYRADSIAGTSEFSDSCRRSPSVQSAKILSGRDFMSEIRRHGRFWGDGPRHC